MTRFWISWEEPMPDGDYRPFVVPVEPHITKWWCSGYGEHNDEEYATLCAVVDAESEEKAEEAVKKFWKPQSWRFCDVREDNWRPPKDRFPWSE
jgi:hypothetical protein